MQAPADASSSNLGDEGDESWSQHVEADEHLQRMSSSALDLIITEEEGNGNNDRNHRTGLLMDDDDDDNWSRQVETDEIQRMPSSVLDMEDMASRSVNNLNLGTTSTDSSGATDSNRAVFRGAAGRGPKREEPTMKEKLVERERQRRVETERARLKRQFALSSNNGGGGIADEDSVVRDDGTAHRENGSVAGTAGEGSSVAQTDPYGDEQQKLTYPMERFLQEQGTVIEEEPTRENTRDVQNQGVVMERFLQEPVVVVESQEPEESESERPNVDRSVSFDVEPHPSGLQTTALESEPPISAPSSVPSISDSNDDYLNSSIGIGASISGNASNTSVDSENRQIGHLREVSGTSELGRDEILRSDSMERHHPPSELESPSVGTSNSFDQPRVFRLTAEEIQEMAAIEEASRSNAPPSERDDISDSSFVGELVSDFGGAAVDATATLSQGTPTTAMESASSMVSGNQSAQPMSDNDEDQHSIEAMGTGSISSHVNVSSTGGSVVSVTANLPSDIGAEEVPPAPIPDEIHSVEQGGIDQQGTPTMDRGMADVAFAPIMPTPEDEPLLDPEVSAALNAGVINRKIRPGMFTAKQLKDRIARGGQETPSTPIRRSLSVPDKMDFELDGFDYDKDAPMSPASALSASIRELPGNDMWSPGSRLSLSPFYSRTMASPADAEMARNRNYGTATRGLDTQFEPKAETDQNAMSVTAVCGDETQPLIPDIPKEIVATREESSRSDVLTLNTLNPHSLHSKLVDVFSDIRSESTATVNACQNEAKDYLNSGVLKRAFPERLFALAVTLLVEIPVLLMVSGGGDRLCMLIGRTKYHLLMGLLPLSSAISGNVGLQSSTLTTRAVSHGHVTPDNYRNWLLKEIGAALYLGLCMGTLLGFIAFSMSNYDFAFGLTVMIAQFVSILTAGCTGTLAPLLFSFIFERDAGKWGGPLETAIQDIVGSFAMVVMSYKILEFFGPMDIDPRDVCGSSDIN